MTTPYRDDSEASEAEYLRLTRTLAELRSREAALKTEELGVEEDLRVLRQKLDAVRGARAMPILENLRVASPCKADWDLMVGDEKQRFCEQCQKDVYNLSSMTRAEAEAFVHAQTVAPCVRLYRRADGTIITADCPVGVRTRRVRLRVIGGVGGGLIVASAAVVAAMPTLGADVIDTQHGEAERPSSERAMASLYTMGEIAETGEIQEEPAVKPKRAPRNARGSSKTTDPRTLAPPSAPGPPSPDARRIRKP